MRANLFIQWMTSLFVLLATITCYAGDDVLLPKDDASRFVALTKEIRCVVCQNQNLADSTAPIANDLRQKIYTMILENKSDAEIKEYLVKRYGEFILLRPRFSLLTWFLWLFPVVGIAGFFLYLYRFKSTPAAA